jgi:hypothetical protein
MAETLFASFASKDDAERAAGALLDHGLKDEDVSLVAAGTEEDARSWGTKGGAAILDRTDDLRTDTYEAGDLRAGDAGTPDLRAGDSAYDAYGGAGLRETYTAGDVEPVPVSSGLGATTDSYHAATSEDVHEAREAREAREEAEEEAEDQTKLGAKTGLSTTTPGDAEKGALAGAGIGAGIGALAALGSLFIPGVGLVVGSGALAMALAGAAGTAAAGAVAGGATGYLMDLGVESNTARTYDDTIRSGGAVLAIQLPSGDLDAAAARDILTKYNATNLSGAGARL